MPLIPQTELDFWVKNNLNVLFIGHAGIGKTSIILDTFKKHNLKFQYYSCSTLDPYVDFIGVPREMEDPLTGDKVLDLVRPKQWAKDEIEVLFLDEFNRSKQAVRNAVMELIQFKSINGKKFNNLKMVWAAINPQDENEESVVYDVEELDPAQKDRFHIHFDVPYEIDNQYFINKHGKIKASIAMEWWNALDKTIKLKVSPRRVDYALDINNLGGNIEYVLPKTANPKILASKLQSISSIQTMLELVGDPSKKEELKTFLDKSSSLTYCLPYVKKERTLWKSIYPIIPTETLSAILIEKENKSIVQFVVDRSELFEDYLKMVASLDKKNKLKELVASKVIEKGSEGLKKLFDVKETSTPISTRSTADSNAINWLNGTTDMLDQYKISQTADKMSALKTYVRDFGSLTNKHEDLLKKEAIFLYAIAKKVHKSTFDKMMEPKVIEVFRDCLPNIHDIANKVFKIKYPPTNVEKLYKTHFESIFGELPK